MDRATPGTLLQEYLAGRVESDDYRARLGLIGTVRSDLQVLSDAVAQHNELLVGADAPDELDDVLNRVVLYIDDLDRCPPQVVVRVLEAVNLLLAFPLFVVVVGVDATWVARALQTVYPELLRTGDVRPDHYLEKIFQLPVWLDPPTAERAAGMLDALLGPALGHAVQAHEPGAAPLSESDSESEGRAATGPRSGERSPSLIGGGAQVRVDLATSEPRALSLDDLERQNVRSYSPLLTRSPRALKRYLNTYRLLKGLVPGRKDREWAGFLLAVATGDPDLGQRLLDRISATDADVSLGTVVDGLPPNDVAALDTVGRLRNGGHVWRDYRCADLKPAVDSVRRFTFRASH